MEIIEELEPHRRHGYCGAIGYISFNGNMDSNITIRTLLTYKKQVYCWAGGGIVADSQADKEYQETFDKLSLILPLLERSITMTELNNFINRFQFTLPATRQSGPKAGKSAAVLLPIINKPNPTLLLTQRSLYAPMQVRSHFQEGK